MFPCLQDKEPLGIIPLENLSVQKVNDPKKPVSVYWLALCQHRLSDGWREEKMYTNSFYPTQITSTLLASQREGAIADCLVSPSRHDCVSNLCF